MSKPMNELRRDTRGAIYVEFLLVFIPIFTMFLGMLQMALMYTGNIVVQHASVTAARAAIVVLDDDPKYYQDAERNVLTEEGGEGWQDKIYALLDKIDTGLEEVGLGAASTDSPSSLYRRGGPRLQDIRTAASIPLLAIAPNFQNLLGTDSVYRAIGGNPGSRALGGAVYNRAAMAVTFPTSPGANEFRTDFGATDDVTVRVTYLFHCAIPLANRLMCKDPLEVTTGVSADRAYEIHENFQNGSIDPSEVTDFITDVRNGRSDASDGAKELTAAESPWMITLTVATGARYVILRGESTLPNQGASSVKYIESEAGGGGGGFTEDPGASDG